MDTGEQSGVGGRLVFENDLQPGNSLFDFNSVHWRPWGGIRGWRRSGPPY